MVATYGLAALVVGAYVAWVVVRYRREREQKRLAAAASSPAPGAFLRPPAAEPPVPAPPVHTPTPAREPLVAAGAPAAQPAAAPQRPASPYPAGPPTQPTTVVSVLDGITMPCDLAPLTSYAPRPRVADQVVFVTDAAPHEVVRTQVESALVAIGVHVDWVDAEQARLVRGGHEALMVVPLSPHASYHGDSAAYPVLPPQGVVVDVWVP